MLRRKAWEFDSPHPHQMIRQTAAITLPYIAVARTDQMAGRSFVGPESFGLWRRHLKRIENSCQKALDAIPGIAYLDPHARL